MMTITRASLAPRWENRYIWLTHLRLTPSPNGEIPGDDLHKIFRGCQGTAKINGKRYKFDPRHPYTPEPIVTKIYVRDYVVDIYHPAKFDLDRIRGFVSTHARFRASNCLLSYLFVFFGFRTVTMFTNFLSNNDFFLNQYFLYLQKIIINLYIKTNRSLNKTVRTKNVTVLRLHYTSGLNTSNPTRTNSQLNFYNLE